MGKELRVSHDMGTKQQLLLAGAMGQKAGNFAPAISMKISESVVWDIQGP